MMRVVFSVFLALVLSWATVPMAVARATMAGSVTICTGDGVQVIALDAKGDPVATHPCPDCSLAAVALLPAPAQTPAIVAAPRAIALPQAIWQAPAQTTPRLNARGPPSLA
jgi:hypothetical protein